MTDRTHGWIRVRGLRVEDTRVGVYPHERELPRRLTIDVALWTDVASAAASESLRDTIDYDRVIELVQRVCKQRHYVLIEALCEALAEALLAHFPARRVAVEVHKPGAVAAGEVSVAVERGAS